MKNRFKGQFLSSQGLPGGWFLTSQTPDPPYLICGSLQAPRSPTTHRLCFSGASRFPSLGSAFADSDLWLVANVTGMNWNLSVVWVCISFMAKNVEHRFMSLLAICISSSENCLLNLVAHLLIGYLFFCCLAF
jgi:hypothetical protein